MTDTRGGHKALVLAALGIVYGDIGTSPLYAIRECFRGNLAIQPDASTVLGVLSVIFWSLILVISIKYVWLTLRADNDGEGGILAMLSLVTGHLQKEGRFKGVIIGLGIGGAALMYADAMITPAISVLSAVEGLEVIAPDLGRFVVPCSIAILTALFLIQHHGTHWIGILFGPVMLLWFLSIGTIGALSIAESPEVLAAINPVYAVRFFLDHGWVAFTMLGFVILVITGGEALYADMGHVGARAIRIAWFGLVLPALVLSYFGQGAMLLRAPEAIGALFFTLPPRWAVLPMVVLATLATVIASQAVISGVYSLTRQAVQLGYIPRARIVQTSEAHAGQIYVPLANWAMLIATVWLVLEFRDSGGLAAAYGVAVAGSMFVTALFLYYVARAKWRWSRPLALAVALPFIVIHLAFFASTLLRIPAGGWLPLVVAISLYVLFNTWRRGRRYMARVIEEETIPLNDFIASLRESPVTRVPGTAVFLTSSQEGVPRTLLHNLKHNQVLHEHVALVTVRTASVPRVRPEDRIETRELGAGFHRFVLIFGYHESPDVAATLEQMPDPPCGFQMMTTSYFSGRETVVLAKRPRLPLPAWRRVLFGVMQHNALDATRYFGIPPNRVIQIGSQLEI
jgi:KUP system potassium uptake protein